MANLEGAITLAALCARFDLALAPGQVGMRWLRRRTGGWSGHYTICFIWSLESWAPIMGRKGILKTFDQRFMVIRGVASMDLNTPQRPRPAPTTFLRLVCSLTRSSIPRDP